VRRSFAQAQIRQRLSHRHQNSIRCFEAASIRASAVGATGLRRATTARIQEAQREIIAVLRETPPNLPAGTRVGEIAMNVWSRTRARDPNAGPVDARELPENNKTMG